MWQFSIRKSFGMMVRTAPFLLFRMAVYFGIAVALVLATGAGAGIGYGVGGYGDSDFRAASTLWGGGISFALVAGTVFFLREYVLYLVKAGHIALMVDLIDGRPLPAGRGQIAHARHVVTERFAESSVLFGVDQLVKGVVNMITGLTQGLLSVLPVPGLDRVVGLIRAFLKVSVGLVDEVIIAHAIRTGSTNPWSSARDALVLYGQNAKPMMINAAWITAISWVVTFVIFLLFLAPAAAVAYLIPGAWSSGGFVFALVFAWAAKVAVLEPFAIACLLQAFVTVTDGQTPDPEWQRKLDGASEKFKTLGQRAVNWASRDRTASAKQTS